jgi:hypothetical protein
MSRYQTINKLNTLKKYNMKINRFLSISALAIFTLNACKKDNAVSEPTPEDKSNGEVTFKFKNRVNNDDLVLSTNTSKVWYKNQNNDSFTVTKFNYYITNIKLNAEDGSVFSEPNSYHLLKQDDANSLSFSLKDIPAKKYLSVSYMIGVDSVRNVSGAQTGALDPINDMFWTWNSGYIFVKLEGNSPSSTSSQKALVFHIGGFTGPYKGLKQNTFNLPEATLLNGSNKKTLNMKVDVNEIFKNPQTIDFSTLNFAMTPSTNTKKIADNFADMISLISVE